MNKDIGSHEKYKLNHRINNDGLIERRCTKCQEWNLENINNFYMVNKTIPKSGFTPACKKCSIKASRKYQVNNEEESKRKKIEWYEDHKELNWKRANQWKAENPEYALQCYREWARSNPDKLKEYNEKHRNHDITESEWRNCLRVFSNKCAYCGLSIEQHIVKLNGKYIIMNFHKEHVDDQGYNDLRNAIPACRNCNSSKHQHNIEDWYFKQKFFDEVKYNFIIWWTTEGYKDYIEDKPPYRIIRKRNEGLSTYHFELWSVDEMRNFVELIDVGDKKKDLDLLLVK